MSSIIEKVVGDFGDKRRWREYKARVKAMPAPYRITCEGVERYLLYYGSIAKGEVLIAMVEDLADLFEQAAADGRPVRAIVGDDPVGFAEGFLRNYADGQWINKERERLVKTVARAEREERG